VAPRADAPRGESTHGSATARLSLVGSLQHDLTVTGIDWCPLNNRLLTCSQDRTALVWTQDPSTTVWSQQLVLLRINRAATDCRWCPDGTKFAVSSGSKSVAICAYEAENDWWFASQIQRFKSTVNTVSWHPNSKLVAAASCDYHCRVAAAWMPDVGDEADLGPFGSAEGYDFGDLVIDLSLDDDPVPSTWVNDVAWSPSGMQLAFVSQGSNVFVMEVPAPGAAPTKLVLRHEGLPFLRCAFLDDKTLVAVGFDMNPAVFSKGASGWAFSRYADTKPEGASEAKASNAFSAARAMFASKVSTGRSAAAADMDKLDTRHEGSISDIRVRSRTVFSTVGTDGRLVLWTV
jgi:actin related protein 2/3 complex, subunit 1A/1B